MRRIVLAVLVLALSGVLQAQRVVYYQVTTVDNSTTYPACTAASTPANCSTDTATTGLYCTIETGSLRWLATGTPTTTVGHLAQAGTSISIAGNHANIVNFKMIATTATAATVTCEVSRP